MSGFRNAVWANTQATACFVRSCHKKHMTQGQTRDHQSTPFGSGHGLVFLFSYTVQKSALNYLQ